jgi:hypothetical protein
MVNHVQAILDQTCILMDAVQSYNGYADMARRWILKNNLKHVPLVPEYTQAQIIFVPAEIFDKREIH